MNKKHLTVFIYLLAIACLPYFFSCSKAAVITNPPAPGDTCSVVVINPTITSASSCLSNGSVIIAATGSNGFMYKLGSSGTYQSSDTLNNIAAGTYTVYVKDSAGCVTTANVTITSNVIIVNATPTSSSPCSNDGSVTVNAGSGFSYKLGSNGTYQASGLFTSVAAGSYTVYAKDSTSGCETTASVSVGVASPGAMFAAVKSLIAAKCESCHNAGNANEGFNWDMQCSIINNELLIQSQVNSNQMPYGGPPLTTDEKAVINDWINAGGAYSN